MKIKDIENYKTDTDLSKKNHIVSISLFDNKDGTMHGLFQVTPEYFDNDMKKINNVVLDSIMYLKNKLLEHNVFLISTIH